MNWRKVFSMISLLVIAAMLAPNLLAGASSAVAAAERTQVVRVPAEAGTAFARLGLQPRLAVDYGSFMWYELSAADLRALTSSSVPFSLEPNAGVVQAAEYRFDPMVDGEPSLPAHLRLDGVEAGFRLVQMIGPARDSWLAQLSSQGLVVLQYYPHNAYLVWATQVQGEAAAQLDFVRWQGVFQPAYRLSPALAGTSGLIENVAIVFYNDGRLADTLAQISALGGQYVQHFAAQPDLKFYTAIYKLDAAQLDAVANINAVWSVGYSAPQPGLDDEMSTQNIAGNIVGGTPVVGYYDWLTTKGVDGDGITWADVDTGLNSTHPDITGRAVAFITYPGAPAANTDSDGHGSHTAGAIFGDPRDGTGILSGDGYYWGMGAAPGASLVVQNALMGSNWPPTGGWELLSKDSVLNGAIGSSNSWYTGASTPQGYSAAARTHDIMVRDANFDTPVVAEPLIMVFSIGNGGPGASTMTEPKEAKNLITVGASQNYSWYGASVNDMASFSSRGPALDGRLLPNVIAPGNRTASFNGTGSAMCDTALPGTAGTYYNWCQGTSMAAPLVSGAAALISDWWDQEGWGVPSPAMVKALLINGASDMFGGSGVNGHLPNNNQGWGRVNLNNVIRNGLGNMYHDQDYLFTDTGQTKTYTYGVADPSQPLKISLVWSDAPGAVSADPALVNNLNLTVTNGGITYMGNVFTNGWSTPGGSDDNLNNIENVYIQAPASGSVQITINAVNVAGDGVPYNGDTTDQDFALVCYNCLESADFTQEVTPEFQSVCAPDAANYDVTLGSLLGFAQEVSFSAFGVPTGTTAIFSPDAVTPPGMSVLTITDTISGTAGLYDITVVGQAITQVHTSTVQLELFTVLPGVPVLGYPASEETNVPLPVVFTWSATEQAVSYGIEIATDADFTQVVDTADGLLTTTYTPTSLGFNTVYYWRTWANNTCGSSNYSSVYRFITQAEPGTCSLGRLPVTLLSENFDDGEPQGWTHGGDGDTWQLSEVRRQSLPNSYQAEAVAAPSDQWLLTPPVVLSADDTPMTLSFWNYQRIQDLPPNGCYDGAILEVTTDGGATWTQLESQLLVDPYDGEVATGGGNPLAGRNAWCGNPQTGLTNLVDLNEFAGQTVQFRFMLGTNNAIATEGWYLDDVVVQSCVPAVEIEAGETLLAAPGETITHTFTVTNEGATDTFHLELGGYAWPTGQVGSDVITVAQGTTATISVVVEVPLDAAPDSSDTFTLTLISVNVPGLSVETQGTTMVLPVAEEWYIFLPVVTKDGD